MSDEIIIRLAEPEDVAGMLELYAQPDYDDGHVLALDKAKAVFERAAAYPYYKFHVAEFAGRIVGTYALLVMDNIGHLGTPSAIVESVAVSPDVHGKGIGRLMMQHAMKQAASRGCYKLALSSNARRHRAHDFYRNMGFEQHGISLSIRLEQA